LPTEATLNSERPSSTVRLLPDMIYKVQVSYGQGQGRGGSLSEPLQTAFYANTISARLFLPDRLVMQGLPEELSHTSLRRLVVNNVLRILPSTGRTHCILVNSDGKSPRPRIMAINTEF
jgi:hypothetical protein